MPEVPEFRVLSASEACEGYIQRASLVACESGLFWLQSEPHTGANRLWHLPQGGNGTAQLHNADLSIRSRVNGYGGGAIAASSTGTFVVSDRQRIHFLRHEDGYGRALTSDEASYGGLVADPLRDRVLAVRETAEAETGPVQGRQELVAVGLEGELEVLHCGEDFYSAPALSADGCSIAWVSWRLPDMPWVRTRLWTANIGRDGKLMHCRVREAPKDGAVQQPVFAGQTLWVMSDHEGWWQPWQVDHHDVSEHWLIGSQVPPLDHANAPWQLGESYHCPLPHSRWARVCYRNGTGELWISEQGAGGSVRVARSYSDFRSLCAVGSYLYVIARSPGHLDAVLQVDPDTGCVRVVAGGEEALPGYQVSLPRTFQIPACHGDTSPSEGFYYPPVVHAEKAPPLILVAHGGPTSAAYPVFNPHIQFWCQRGFAVAEVNYRGSSGFGRDFRLSLAGRWGEADVTDMAQAADYLVAAGLADDRRLFIQGRSSGGYTALMALIGSCRYAGGASLYGVTDPMQLRRMTHRFESGYLDWLLGDPRQYSERWNARTPRLQAAAINTPLVFFQGGLDRVVVPEQTRDMVRAMEMLGQAPELHWFPTEGHGFVQQQNQARMLDALHEFYNKHGLKP
ncbi:alpha/beta hydrolase family protein [Marinobacter sp. F3R11]|uniref:alpha/beta hydrolase family protein n=1 Tax=Marinobacter sp. F3R11 TaxID=2267231 RepID=UPI000DEB4E1F|nr:prolyl oligopeptidase family serine peptidase [Marinobacter sp. F3R11]RBW48926.1 S9 family peptidase [Marinobacter sp. F3R11]